jgi:ankyrin repeat protein
VSEIVVTGERKAPAPKSSFFAPRGRKAEARDAVGATANRASASADVAVDPAAKLRAVAAAGRVAEVNALLDQGAAVDAPDADGNTALMAAVLADHPAVAATLRRHGASLDRQNHAGESARDMAATKADAALDHALGLAP